MSAILAETMTRHVWFDKSKVEDAEYKYYTYLAKKNHAGTNSNQGEGSSGVAQQIADAREKIQQSLKTSQSPAKPVHDDKFQLLENENQELREKMAAMVDRLAALEIRVNALEGGKTTTAPVPTPKPAPVPAEKDESESDDDDFDPFAADDSEDERERERIKQERVKAYYERKSKKAAVIAKSNIILDVKPWSNETDMVELEKLVRSIEMDGLLWSTSKLVEVAYGVKKLVISCVVEDDKVGTDILDEKITEFEDHVQSVDIAAFNKI